MRIATLSDVHGNARALEAVLADLRARGPFDQVINAGDSAFGGPRPREAMTRLMADRTVTATLVGNTDQWVTGPSGGPSDLPEAVRHTVAWTRQKLTPQDLAFLGRLPMIHRVEPPGGPPLVVVHATPASTTDDIMPDAPAEVVAQAMEQARTRTLVYGHIHQAYIREVAGRLIVNTGSVGFPFDGDPRPAWAILTLQGGRWQAEILRVAYDYEAVAREFETSDHPSAAT